MFNINDISVKNFKTLKQFETRCRAVMIISDLSFWKVDDYRKGPLVACMQNHISDETIMTPETFLNTVLEESGLDMDLLENKITQTAMFYGFTMFNKPCGFDLQGYTCAYQTPCNDYSHHVRRWFINAFDLPEVFKDPSHSYIADYRGCTEIEWKRKAIDMLLHWSGRPELSRVRSQFNRVYHEYRVLAQQNQDKQAPSNVFIQALVRRIEELEQQNIKRHKAVDSRLNDLEEAVSNIVDTIENTDIDEPIKEYIESQLTDLDSRIELQLTDIKDDIDQMQYNLDKRIDEVSDDMISINEIDDRLDSLKSELVDEIESQSSSIVDLSEYRAIQLKTHEHAMMANEDYSSRMYHDYQIMTDRLRNLIG